MKGGTEGQKQGWSSPHAHIYETEGERFGTFFPFITNSFQFSLSKRELIYSPVEKKKKSSVLAVSTNISLIFLD